jgi:superfamily II DNA or RNA helicase
MQQPETITYQGHLANKAMTTPVEGFDWTLRPESAAFPFQRDTVEWALRRGRAAIFADTGLGKTLMQLEWANAVAEHTGGRVLILSPLAVGPQTVREAGKFGIPGVRFVRKQDDVGDARVVVCNYESLHRLDIDAFVGVVLDESSILKSYMGATKRALISGFADTPYRLACTATPAPNDYLELGNHSEFLGVLNSTLMIARWFITDQSAMGVFRLKGHARLHFWDWVATWSRCIGKPSDIGPYDDTAYNLPELVKTPHMVSVDITTDRGDGHLFRKVALSATDIHREKRRSAPLRAAKVAELVMAESDEPWLIWCETNYEADALAAVLPTAIEVRGNTRTELKESRLLGFGDAGGYLVTKPKIAGFGLNWQHCARVAFVGGSYSYEAFYQAVRRCWRFGQKRPVHVHIVMGKTESALWQVVTRKAGAHEAMKLEMFAASRRSIKREARSADYHPTHLAPVPSWLHGDS